MLDLDAEVTAAEAASQLPQISRQLIAMWVKAGKLTPCGRTGRSPLYRWGDILAVEAATRNSPYSSRYRWRDRKPLAAGGERPRVLNERVPA